MVRGSYSFVLALKLEELKNDLKVWNKEVFGMVSIRKEEALKQIAFWDLRERETVLNSEDGEVRRLFVEDYNKWAIMEESLFR